MIRLCALNDDSSEESDHEPTQESVKQAKESEALELYNKGLALQQKGDYEQAEEAYNHLLNSALVKEAPPPEEEAGLVELSQVLKYSAYKNLASLAEKRDQWEKSIDAYLQAVALDDSDVTVWYHLGVVAMKAYDLCLARHSFEEGLKCNPKHWPCLDLLCTVLYSIADYYTCLVMISKALERDEDYIKGMALKNQIFSEEPALKRDSQHLRNLFMSSFVGGEETRVEMAEFVKEAVRLREERLKLIEADRAPPPPLTPVKPLTSHTWASLGECFIALYDHLTKPENPQPLGRRVDLEGYYKAIVTPDISMSYRASVIKVPDYSSSSFSTEGFTVYKSGQSGEGEDKNKKGTKRKKPPAASVESDFLPKRRSARVRTNKKKEEEVNYRELILSFIPSVSRPSCVNVDDESSQDSLADGIQFGQRGSQSQITDGKPGEGFSSDDRNRYDEVITGEAETLDILTFVKEQMENGGIIDLMNQYGICLAAQNNKKWPFALADVFLKVYQRMRKHVILPSEFCCDQDELYRTRMAKLILVANELTLDKLLTAKSKSSSSLSPASSPRGGSTVVSPLRGSGFSSQYLATDMEYLHRISSDRTIHGDFTLEMATRVNWMKARYLMLQGQMDFAMVFLDRSSKLLTLKVNSIEGPTTIKLVNCKVDNIITLDQVQKKLESLQRCQSLEEVHRLYESGLYEDVVQLLMPTLYQPQPKTKASELGMSIPERPAQLLLLQDSLIKLKEYEKCLTCSEVALNEAVSQMSPCEAWSTTLARLFACIDRSILESKTVLSKIPQEKLNRLTQNIIKVLEASMYAVENSSEPPLATAKPWVLLYRIIKHQEKDDGSWDKATKTYPSATAPPTDSPMTETASTDGNLDSVSVSSDMPNVSPSLQFLRIAHENLGRRGWCCNNDGVFLLLKVNVLIEELTKPVLPGREDLVRDLEQCFLCLYGHPSKKAKSRGLQEHSSSQIALTWSNSAVVFDYFKPPEPPTFDSKANTISAEVQNLLRRITIVIPQHELEDISFESVQAFIEGGDEPVPKLPDRLVGVKRPVIGEIFYLLADFFFKNKEFSKALKFYMHDVCVQPDRADTWAAMALARKSRLENKLNACEPKSEGPIQKLAVSALRCFKRALEIDGSNSSLWEEYGSLCYVLYSHASRQLNQFDKDEMSPDSRQSQVQRRDDMLLLSESCFTSALGIEDAEPWLHHYILGKILEKLKKPPGVYLEHYQKSAKYLDDDISSYPRRISYYSPPEHSLEALEIYFRIHVSIIKLLFDKFPDVDVTVLEEHLQRASQGPFYQPEFDADTGQGIIYRSESTTSESLSVSAFEEAKQNETKSKVTTSGEESINKAEVPLKEESDLTKAKDTLAEEPKDVAMETTSREVEGHLSTASSLQSEESSAPTPMEVEQSAPSSSVTSPQPANDGAHVVASPEHARDGAEMQTDRRKTLETSQCLSETVAKESLAVSTFEETKQNETKSKDTTTGEESTTEKPLKEESDLTEAKDILAEEPRDVAMEAASREVEGHFSAASSSQSEESSARTPMEVEQSAPSSGVTSPKQAQDGAQTPLSSASQGARVGLGASQTTEDNLEEENISKTDDNVNTKDVKEKEQTESCIENKASLLESEENKTCVSESRQDGKSIEEVQMVANEPPEEKGLLEGGDVEEIQVEPVKPQEENSEKDDHEVPEQVETRNPDPDNCDVKKDDGDKTEQEKPSVDKPEANREPESMETDEASTVQQTPVDPVESTDVITPTSSGSHVTSDVVIPTSSSSHVTSPAGPEILPAQSVPERPPLTTEQQVKKKELMDRCIRALEYCLRRFSQHHKSRYRLAYVYYYSPEHKEVSACRDLLLGSSTRQHKTFPFPHHGVFNEKSKTNLFSAFWRIPEEDIDRPGCFCTHTYKSVALLLEVLRELNEWDTLLLIQNLLYRTPEQGKKYLRDNERHYLAKKAFEYSLEITKVRVSGQDPKVESSILSELVMDVYECWKTGQKYEASVKVTEALLTQTFEMLMATTSVSGESRDSVESPVSSSLLDQALKHCQQYVKPQASSSNTSVSQPPKGSSGTDTGTEATSGSDTEAAPTSTEQTLTVQVQQPKENTLSEKPLEKATETPEQAPTSLPTDSQTVNVHEDLKDESPMKIEEVPKVTVTPSSQEAVGLESVTPDPGIVTLDSNKAKPEEQEKPVSVTGNTGILKIVEPQVTQEAPRTVEVVLEAGVKPNPSDQGGLDSTANTE